MKKQKLTFESWWKELKLVAEQNGFEPTKGFREEFIQEIYREFYNDGLTPKQAWKKA